MNATNAESAKRFVWIDYAKVVGIFLVVFGHTSVPGYLYNAIFSFHMPLFFFISGYLFSFKKYDSYKHFLYKRSKQLVVPYFYLNIITYIFWFFIGRKFGNDSTKDIPFYTPIIGVFYGNGTGDYLVHNIASWFLACLFIVENLFYLCFKNIETNKRGYLLTGFTIVGYLDYTYDPIRWPWSFNVALIALVFYGLANIYKKEIDKFLQIRAVFLVLLMLLFFPIYIFFFTINKGVNLNSNYYHNYWYFWPGALSGILIVIIISRLLELVFGKRNFIEYISKNTIIILVFEFIAMSIIKGFTIFILRIPITNFDNKVFINILESIIVIIMLVPLMVVVNKYLPFLIGRENASGGNNGFRIMGSKGIR